jgi:hypothetical protein
VNFDLWGDLEPEYVDRILVALAGWGIDQNRSILVESPMFQHFLAAFARFRHNPHFLVILEKVGWIALADCDVEFLFSNFDSEILNVIHDLSDVILSVKSPHFDCVSVIFSIVRGATSLEFVVKSLFAIYELSQNILEHIHLLTYQFREFEDLFELLLLDIEAYPLFIPLLCVLSLPKSQADKGRVAQAISKSATIRTDQLWLIWPMVFCLSVDDICQTLVCYFLARICRFPELISFVVDFFQICHREGLITQLMSFVFDNQGGNGMSCFVY